jgi:hypothetical protein
MASPFTLLHTEAEAIAHDAGMIDGAVKERERIIDLIERNICFDALADADGRCVHHGGKCYELRQLINKLKSNDRNRL